MIRWRPALAVSATICVVLLSLAGLGAVLRERGLDAGAAGDWRAAETRLRWASRLLPGRSPDLDLAETLLRRGNVSGAARLVPPAGHDSAGPDALHWAWVRARVDRGQNRADEALAGFRATARAAAELGDRELEVRARLGEAEVLYAILGRLDEGEAKLTAARKLAERLGEQRTSDLLNGGRQNSDLSKAARVMGEVLMAEASFLWSNRLDRARPPELFEVAIERFERAGDEPGRARALARLGLVYLARGDFSRHTELQEEARAIFHRLGDEAGLAVSENYLGVVLAALERYPEARSRYDRALSTFQELGSVAGERGVLRLIADLELRTGQLDSSRRRLEGLLMDPRPTVERRHALVLLGNVLMHQGEPAAAAERYREAFRLDQRLRPVDYQYRHVPLVMLAHAEHQIGNLDAAMEALDDARLEAVAIDNAPGIATVELAMADFLDSQGRTSEVLDHLESAAAIQAARLGESRMPFFQTQFEQAFERLRVLLFERGVHSAERQRALDLTFQLLELMRFRLHRGLVLDAGNARDEAEDGRGRRGEALEELRGVLAGGDPEAIRQAYRRFGDAVTLDRLGAAEAPTRPVLRRDLQARLDPETIVVEYAFAGDAIVALAVVDAHMEAVQLPLTRRRLEDQVRLFMSQLGSGDEERPLPLAVQLREVLIEPLEALGMKRGGRLAIVPVGPLFELAFAALAREDETGRHVFLVEDWELLMASSATALVRSRRVPEGRGVATFARGTDAAPLPAALEEARAFADRLGGTSLTDDEATESAVRQALEHRGWLHLAVHGVAESEVPLHSRLLLAADDEHDGRLTAREILDLPVACELVILSACRTGLGFSERPDDWTAADRIGLSEALLEAGAGRVVSSLLPLEDRPTADFVAALAERLRQDPEPVSALAFVQRQWAAQHPPGLWAGFRVAGHL